MTWRLLRSPLAAHCIRFGRPEVPAPPGTLALPAAAALMAGVLVAATSPLIVAAGLIGLVVLLLVLARPVAGLFALVGVVATLPFGVIPVRIGVQFTFMDVILIATFAAFLLRVPRLAREPDGLVLGAPGFFLLLFIVVALAAFLVGTGYAPATPEVARRFAKLVASLLLFLVASNLLRTRTTLFALTRALMCAGALAGAVGTALWLLPQSSQLRLLLGLAEVGYPTSNVLRFVPGPNETYTTQLRAIGTSVDPNVFGGSLMLAMGLLAMQWASRERLVGRPLLLLLALPTLSGLLLSLSRASWVGLAVGVLLVGSLRYRHVWIVALLALGLLLALPLGQAAIERFVGGFSSADPATALRLGEYRNALTLLQRYPLTGIGFGASPDIDVTAGVSSVYLLVGEQTGLIGLAAYLAVLIATLLAGLKGLRLAYQDEPLYGVLAGALAAYIGALAAGFADHYFANQAFPHAVALFWLYAAVLVAGARQARTAG
jgi:O-antigen ligase